MKQVTAAIIFKGDKLLLCRRAPESSLPGYWELPGGKIEMDETPQQCLERELDEELSLQGVASEVLGTSTYVYSHGSFELMGILFQPENEPRPTPTIHDELGWFTKSEALQLNLAPADIPLIEELNF